VNPIEFNLAFSKFESSFGKYSELMRSRIQHFCGALSKSEFEQIIQSFVDAGVRKPTVFDFRSKAQGYKAPRKESESTYVEECKVCFDIGILEIYQPESKAKFTLFAMCPCKVGKNSLGDQIAQSWGLPFFGESIAELGFALIPSEKFLEKWKPAWGQSTDSQLQEIWKTKIELSKEFYSQHMKGGNDA
jgi:hypothetical protein